MTEEVSLADLGGEAAKFHKPGKIINQSVSQSINQSKTNNKNMTFQN